ncbi:MAG TPA: kynureninase [Rhizomicrobium sp.]|nr:kynureninase [Rhizomicrobium sp.]
MTMKEEAARLDRQDRLGHLRDQFHLEPGVVYMDGNSLGLLSKPAERSLLETLEAWKRLGIDGWLQGAHPWFTFSEELAALAAPLIGARPGEVLITGSTSVNLHQMLASFFRPEGRRTKILIEEAAFPTDAHAIKSHLKLRGLDPARDIVVVPSRGGTVLEEDDIVAAMNDEVAFAILPVALYRTGQLLDIKRLTDEAHARGIVICFDGCHSVGAVPHALHDDGVDCAIFCTYKYLNGGPGATGGLFVHEKHLGTAPGLASWFSSRKDRQFDMSNDLEHADSASAYHIGTPNILSMAPLLGALELVNGAGIANIRARSLALTQFMITLFDGELGGLGFSLATPRAQGRRGGHIALRHEEAPRIFKALKQRKIIPDFRPPDIVRLAPSPLYTSFAEVAETIAVLKDIAESKAYLEFPNVREMVA